MSNGSVWAPLRALVKYSGKIAGVGILFMMAVTCADIILRRLGTSIPGAYDLVRIAGGITIAAALPLTTAVKGHVAIEYFFHRLGRRGRIIVDSAMRTIQTVGFLFAAIAFLRRGNRLFRSGEVMPTLQCPIFWLAWLIAFMCLLTALVSLFHLLRPGRNLLRPAAHAARERGTGSREQVVSRNEATTQRCNDATMQRRNDATMQRRNDATSNGGAL
jgi:TRAP-type C4-dicarboxylate transport system permease small subunit